MIWSADVTGPEDGPINQENNMSIVTENGIIPERYEVQSIDNRDPATTWLWITDDYVEVNPFELIENMVENCRPWILEEVGIDPKELDDALAVLKRASGS